MKAVALAVQRHSRLSAEVAFGIVTAATIYLAASPSLRLSPKAGWMICAIALAHSAAGAFTGPRILGKTLVNPRQAFLLGASTSFAALLLFVPFFTLWIFSDGNTHSNGVLSFLAMTALVGLFSFAAVGWALIMLAGLTGVVLSRVAAFASQNPPPAVLRP